MAEETTSTATAETKPADGLKTVNVPLSASNGLQPEAGIQVATTANTKDVDVTDPYDPQKTKVQAVADGKGEVSDEVTQEKYDQLKQAFESVLEGHVMDVTHQTMYKQKAGLA